MNRRHLSLWNGGGSQSARQTPSFFKRRHKMGLISGLFSKCRCVTGEISFNEFYLTFFLTPCFIIQFHPSYFFKNKKKLHSQKINKKILKPKMVSKPIGIHYSQVPPCFILAPSFVVWIGTQNNNRHNVNPSTSYTGHWVKKTTEPCSGSNYQSRFSFENIATHTIDCHWWKNSSPPKSSAREKR